MNSIAAVRHFLLMSGPLLTLAAGCALFQPQVDLAMHSQAGPAARKAPSADYAVCCPDVLVLRIQGEPRLTGRHPIGQDGRIQLGRERILVDGLNTSAIVV